MSLLPPNASPLELAFEQALAAPVLPVPLRAVWSAASCPEAALPWLAWALSVDKWDASWPLATRRKLVADAIDTHRKKGTLSAVRQAVAAFGGSITLREWWEQDPPGTPGTFSILLALGEIDGDTPGADYIADTIQQVTVAKPLSRSFDFTLAQNVIGAIGMAAAARPVAYARLDMAA